MADDLRRTHIAIPWSVKRRLEAIQARMQGERATRADLTVTQRRTPVTVAEALEELLDEHDKAREANPA